MAPNDIVLAFDAYGTLLSTESIAKKLATHFGEEKAQTIAVAWRRHQLEYTWRLNSMGIYFDFFSLTRRALRHAMNESGVSLNENETKEMMEAYDSLSTFPDVQPMLAQLKETKDIRAVIFSNGTHDMVSSSVKNSPDLSPYAGRFQEIVSVDACRKYKPAHEVYQYLAEKMGKDALDAKGMSQVWLVSGNPFDVVGARAVGMSAIWVDRAGTGWLDCLIPAERNRPNVIVRGLDEVFGVITKVANGR